MGTMGVAMSWEWACSSEAPAGSPWFLKTMTYSRRGSLARSMIRSRYARRTSATWPTGSCSILASCSGASITTSWAPTPFIRSKMPSPEGSSSPSIRSAGNLFGTTRTSHPGLFGALAAGRRAHTSSGVLDSWPAQNTQGPRRRSGGFEMKSDGRRDRSEEMMTHRPTTGSRRSSGTFLLRSRFAGEQRLDRLPDGLAFEEHGAHFPADRHRDAGAPGAAQRRGYGAHALRDHRGCRLDLAEGAASRDLAPEGAVAAERARAGQHEVAQTGEAEEGGRLGAQRHAEPHDLGEPPGDERRSRVLPEREPVAEPGGDGDDVLQRRRDLDADHVAVRVEPERRSGERALEGAGETLIRGGDHERGRLAEGHLAGKGRTREHGQRVSRQQLAEQDRDAAPTPGLEPLGGRDDGGARRDPSLRGRERRLDEMGRHRRDDDARSHQRLLRIAGHQRSGRHRDAGQIPAILAGLADLLDQDVIASPQARTRPEALQVNGQRRAPAPGAEKRDGRRRAAHAGLARSPSRGSRPLASRCRFARCRTMMMAAAATAAPTAARG